MTTQPNELLHPAAVAETLGVPVRTLEAWRYRREGPPYVKVGRRIRYRSVDLENWILGRVESA